LTRRGANEGTIRQRKDGRWEARVLLTGADGRRTRRSLLGRTRADVRDRLAQTLRAEAAGLPVPSGRLTVAAFLDLWLRETVRPTVRPATFRSYEGIVRVHLQPGLGGHLLAQLTPQHVQRLLNAKSATNLAPRTIAYIRSVLRQALRQAERWGMVSRNVASLAAPPRVPRREIRPLSPDEARRFVEAIRGDRLGALYLLAIGTGLRQGEILGLGWQEVDLSAATITVRHALQRVGGRLELVSPKSLASRRVVALRAFVVDALHAHRLRQRRDRLLAGARWRIDERGLVFTTTVGTPMDGISVTRRFQAVLRQASLPHQRFSRSPPRLRLAPSRSRRRASRGDGDPRPQPDSPDPQHVQPRHPGPWTGGGRRDGRRARAKFGLKRQG
jgi:integrase